MAAIAPLLNEPARFLSVESTSCREQTHPHGFARHWMDGVIAARRCASES
jgi:hypothetical protein